MARNGTRIAAQKRGRWPSTMLLNHSPKPPAPRPRSTLPKRIGQREDIRAIVKQIGEKAFTDASKSGVLRRERIVELVTEAGKKQGITFRYAPGTIVVYVNAARSELRHFEKREKQAEARVAPHPVQSNSRESRAARIAMFAEPSLEDLMNTQKLLIELEFSPQTGLLLAERLKEIGTVSQFEKCVRTLVKLRTKRPTKKARE